MRWHDMDIAQAIFPEHEELIERAAETNPDNRGIDWWFGRQLSEPRPARPRRRHRRPVAQYDGSAWSTTRVNSACSASRAGTTSLQPTRLGMGSARARRVRMAHPRARHGILDWGILWDGWSPYKPIASRLCRSGATEGLGTVPLRRHPQPCAARRSR